MVNKPRNYFPLIRKRKEVLKEIGANSGLQVRFQSWATHFRENAAPAILLICC